MNDGRRVEARSHMLQSARLACSYVEGMSRADFPADTRTQQAVVMNMIIIGEAAARLLLEHTEFTQAHADIPWRGMKSMRNRIAHGYFEVDFRIVWDTVQTSLPDLIARLETSGA